MRLTLSYSSLIYLKLVSLSFPWQLLQSFSTLLDPRFHLLFSCQECAWPLVSKTRILWFYQASYCLEASCCFYLHFSLESTRTSLRSPHGSHHFCGPDFVRLWLYMIVCDAESSLVCFCHPPPIPHLCVINFCSDDRKYENARHVLSSAECVVCPGTFGFVSTATLGDGIGSLHFAWFL